MSINADTLEGDGQLEQDWDYTQLSTLPKSVICEDLYYYQNGFKDASYLIPYKRETFYNERKERSYIRNYYQKIIDSAKNGVFSEEIQRTSDNDLIDAFLENPMQNGTSINEAMDYACLFSLNCGFVCTIVDNWESVPEMSEAELIASGKLPYIYFRKPDSIKEFEVDSFGLLESITFCEGKQKINGKDKETYKRWDKTSWTSFYKEGKKEMVIKSNDHNLKSFPVKLTYMGNKRNPEDVTADPRFFALAMVNVSLWNLDSECRDNILASLFPFLAGSGLGNLTALNIGAHGLTEVATNEDWLKYIEPTGNTFEEGRQAKKELVDAILQLAEQSGVTGVQKATSGESKAYDFYASSTLKKEISLKMKELDVWIVDQVADYLNISEYEYNPDYPTTFMPNEADEFTNRLEKLDLVGIPRELKNFYLKKIALQDMVGENPDYIEEVIKAIEMEPDTLPE